MQDRLSTADSIRALLVAIGFRPRESKRFAITLIRLQQHQAEHFDKALNGFLSRLLDTPLLTPVARTIKEMLRCNKHTATKIWDAMVDIWHESTYNICVGSHRLNSALCEISQEPITCTIRIRTTERQAQLVAAAS